MLMMALYQKTAKLTKLPSKRRLLLLAAVSGWGDVYYPQAVHSIFSTYLRFQIIFFFFFFPKQQNILTWYPLFLNYTTP